MNKLFTIFIILAVSLPVVSANKYNSRNIKTDKYTQIVEQRKQKYRDLINSFNEIINKKDFISDMTVDKADSLIVYSTFDTTLYRFSYDEAGSLTGFIEIKKEDGVWTNDYRRSFVYYPTGKLKTQINTRWRNDVWEDYQRINYTYDSYGFEATRLYESLMVSGWKNLMLLTTIYNSNGQRLSELQQEWGETGWVNNYKDQLTYNNLNQLTYEQMDIWQNGAWVLYGKSEYTYTDWGALYQNNYESQNYTGTMKKFRETRLYNSEKLIIQNSNEEFNDTVFTLVDRVTYQYEMNNRVQRRIYEINQNTSLIYNYSEIDTLDAIGNKIIFYVLTWDSTKWVPNNRHYYTYNTNGKLLVDLCDNFVDGNWEKSSKEEYSYDAAGVLLKTFHGSYWNDGAPIDGVSFLTLNIDDYVLGYLFVTCNDLQIFYKKITIPVELTSFSGTYDNGKVLLKWSTATETNNRGFEVERKSASTNWKSIGFVNGAGTTANTCGYLFEDKNAPGEKLYYRLKQIDLDGTFSYHQQIEINSAAIKDFSLQQNFPNPFNPSTVINYTIPSESKVKINIYNTAGQLVKELVNGVKEAGAYNVKFDASNLSSGVYFYSIEAQRIDGKNYFRNSKKMLLVK